MSSYIYQTREVRDLAWACFSPTLLHSNALADDGQNIDNCGLSLSPDREQWLIEIDRQPGGLIRHLSTLHNKRLGLYFESLWHFFLQQDPQVDLIAHNLPVRTPHKTIGEFDCLYYCRQRERHFHLELAVKYYLSRRTKTTTESASHWNEWLGPNNKDNLDRKINHLGQHQIQLGEHPAAQAALEQLGISALNKEIEIKGYLFQSLSDPLPAPYAFNAQRELCHWVTVDKLDGFLNALEYAGYAVLKKSYWLAAAQLGDSDSYGLSLEVLVAKLSDRFRTDNRPQLIAALDSQGTEQTRFFVTGPDWPTHSC